ncbi:MAG: hypothetical protein V4629_04775 [Pseudomonadota bacterium]
MASHVGKTATVLALIEKGAKIDKFNNKRETPLYHAAFLQKKEIVKVLIAAGADVKKTLHTLDEDKLEMMMHHHMQGISRRLPEFDKAIALLESELKKYQAEQLRAQQQIIQSLPAQASQLIIAQYAPANISDPASQAVINNFYNTPAVVVSIQHLLAHQNEFNQALLLVEDLPTSLLGKSEEVKKYYHAFTQAFVNLYEVSRVLGSGDVPFNSSAAGDIEGMNSLFSYLPEYFGKMAAGMPFPAAALATAFSTAYICCRDNHILNSMNAFNEAFNGANMEQVWFAKKLAEAICLHATPEQLSGLHNTPSNVSTTNTGIGDSVNRALNSVKEGVKNSTQKIRESAKRIKQIEQTLKAVKNFAIKHQLTKLTVEGLDTPEHLKALDDLQVIQKVLLKLLISSKINQDKSYTELKEKGTSEKVVFFLEALDIDTTNVSAVVPQTTTSTTTTVISQSSVITQLTAVSQTTVPAADIAIQMQKFSDQLQETKTLNTEMRRELEALQQEAQAAQDALLKAQQSADAAHQQAVNAQQQAANAEQQAQQVQQAQEAQEAQEANRNSQTNTPTINAAELQQKIETAQTVAESFEQKAHSATQIAQEAKKAAEKIQYQANKTQQQLSALEEQWEELTKNANIGVSVGNQTLQYKQQQSLNHTTTMQTQNQSALQQENDNAIRERILIQAEELNHIYGEVSRHAANIDGLKLSRSTLKTCMNDLALDVELLLTAHDELDNRVTHLEDNKAEKETVEQLRARLEIMEQQHRVDQNTIQDLTMRSNVLAQELEQKNEEHDIRHTIADKKFSFLEKRVTRSEETGCLIS